jgi:hypothetical protein
VALTGGGVAVREATREDARPASHVRAPVAHTPTASVTAASSPPPAIGAAQATRAPVVSSPQDPAAGHASAATAEAEFARDKRPAAHSAAKQETFSPPPPPPAADLERASSASSGAEFAGGSDGSGEFGG